MRAVVIDRYGDTDELHLRDAPTPEPGEGMVRLRVICASVNPVDTKLRQGGLRMYYPLTFPCVLGYDVCGVVDRVGPGVTEWVEGDAVFGRLKTGHSGSYAEYCLAHAGVLARKPTTMTFADAAAIPLAAMTALQSMRDLGRLKKGHRVLVNGASGGVGTYAVQIAVALGANVTAVSSAKNHSLVTELGAHAAIDYASTDFTRGNDSYNVVFDAVANQSFWACRSVITPGGAYVNTLISPHLALSILITSVTRWFGSRTASLIQVQPKRADLELLTGWVDEGRLRTVTDSEFNLEDMGLAHERSETGRVRGKVVIRVAPDPS